MRSPQPAPRYAGRQTLSWRHPDTSSPGDAQSWRKQFGLDPKPQAAASSAQPVSLHPLVPWSARCLCMCLMVSTIRSWPSHLQLLTVANFAHSYQDAKAIAAAAIEAAKALSTTDQYGRTIVTETRKFAGQNVQVRSGTGAASWTSNAMRCAITA